MPQLPRETLRRWLPGRDRYPRVCQTRRRRRLRRSHREGQGEEQPARDLREGLPARGAVRGTVRLGQEGAAHSRGRPREVRRRLREGEGGEASSKAEAYRDEGGCRGFGAGRADRRR